MLYEGYGKSLACFTSHLNVLRLAYQVAEAGPLQVPSGVERVKAADVGPVSIGQHDPDHFLTRNAESGWDGIGQDLLQQCSDVEDALGQLLGFGDRLGR